MTFENLATECLRRLRRCRRRYFPQTLVSGVDSPVEFLGAQERVQLAGSGRFVFLGRFWVRSSPGVVDRLQEEEFDLLADAHSWVARSISAHPFATGRGEILLVKDRRVECLVAHFAE